MALEMIARMKMAPEQMAREKEAIWKNTTKK